VVMWQHMFGMPVMGTEWRRLQESSSRLHTVRITGILNICCHVTTMDW